jgi:hypothetical protein
VLGGVEFIGDFDAPAAVHYHFDVVKRVDVNLLNVGVIYPFFQKRIPCHIVE